MAKQQNFDKHARFEGESYQDVLDRDSRNVPEALRAERAPYLGSDSVPASHYTSQARFDLEEEHMWSRVWQMACREDELSNVGDFLIYDIIDKSVLILRSEPDRLQAYYNTCLHRGRKLATIPGNKTELRCPFHGFTWELNGSFKSCPTPWDYQHLTAEKLKLPELKIDTWGGFVFINFDKDAPPLAEVVGPLESHFKNWFLEERYTHYHVSKVIPCNWKVAAEAFMESQHAPTTHPQIKTHITDVNSQYDVFSDYVTRQISAGAEPSPLVNRSEISEQKIVDDMMVRRYKMYDDVDELPEGLSARRYVAQCARESMNRVNGFDYETYSDAELVDSILYNLFPNFSVWGGIKPTRVYRWRPNGRDVDSCIMEIYQLNIGNTDQPKPPPAATHVLSDKERWSDAEELGGLGAIADQDMGNLPYVQEGLKATGNNEVQFANYQDMRIRQHHIMIQRFIDEGLEKKVS
ncbi:MAG: (2Fe-2S)-binding protein [Gammaproteobacteria bacterium]|nr:(2Fe-2S)-binding protein [Gammaproteobacteria bacterium]